MTWVNPTCGPDCSPPSAPTDLVASGTTSTSVTLEWKPSLDSVGVAQYRVFLNGTPLATATQGTTATITGLIPGTTYSFSVTAEDAAGNGSLTSYAIEVSLPGDSQPPSAPTHLVVSNVTATAVTLGWTASTDDTGTVRYEVLDAGAVVATSDTARITLSSLTPSSAHVFTVRAFDAAGNRSAASSAVAVTTRAAAPCASPKNLTGSSYVFNTAGAVCLRTAKAFKGWGCSNARDRSLEVNGVATACGKMPLPAKTADGYYYFDFSAGQYPWAQLYWW
jgi:chitodextrinase